MSPCLRQKEDQMEDLSGYFRMASGKHLSLPLFKTSGYKIRGQLQKKAIMWTEVLTQRT